MAQHIIDALVVTFGLDTKDFQSGKREIEEGTGRLRESSKKAFDDMERAGKKAGETIRGVSREVIGLGLAFMGAKSVLGFAGNLMTSALAAERLGTILGMTQQKVYAWRRAMQEVDPLGGAQAADAALQTVQNAKNAFRLGQLDPAQQGIYGRLGITGNDLRNADPGSILTKLAGESGKMDPTLYAGFLQQLGLSQSATFLLQKGGAQVDALIRGFEKDTKGQEELAKKTEDFQKSMVKLQSTVSDKLVPVLVRIADWLDTFLGGTKGGKAPAPKKEGGWSLDPWGIIGFHSDNGGMLDPPTKRGGSRADRNNNPGNIKDGRFAQSQPGYAGRDKDGFARFASADHGFAAMEALLSRYLRKGKDNLSSIIGTWAPASENNVGAYVSHVSKLTGIAPNQRVGADRLAAVARAMAMHEGFKAARTAHYSSIANTHRNFARHSMPAASVKIDTINVHTRATDAHGIARDLNSAMQARLVVAQSDMGVRP